MIGVCPRVMDMNFQPLKFGDKDSYGSYPYSREVIGYVPCEYHAHSIAVYPGHSDGGCCSAGPEYYE